MGQDTEGIREIRFDYSEHLQKEDVISEFLSLFKQEYMYGNTMVKNVDPTFE